jgi:TonB-linked SusC/RagA family outer membrane protein
MTFSPRGKGSPVPFILKVMRLTFILLTAAFLQVSAHGSAQKVTFSGRDVALSRVFEAIEAQTGYTFFYNNADLAGVSPVTVSLRGASLEEALEVCLKGEPLGFVIKGRTIFISAKVVSVVQAAALPGGEIRGRVTDSGGNALVGASVIVKGTKLGTQTDRNGEFILVGQGKRVVLVISYTGFENRELAVDGSAPVAVRLKRSNSPLDEVQVIAYGTTSQRISTGDVSTVNADVIQKQPVSDPLLALEGRVPGLYITQASGISGSAVNVQILGQNSISEGNAPLYVIDGVPYTSSILPLTNSIQSAGQLVSPSPFAFINPGDIESISVLKDADATAIYGSRAANGAILITTKKGQIGQTTVQFDVQEGLGNVAHRLSLLNTTQYLFMRHKALENDGITSPAPTDYDINGVWDSTRNTDWQKVLLGGSARYTNVQGEVSGGNRLVQFLVGAAYHRESTVFPGSLADQKGSVHANLTNVSENKRFTFQFTANYQFDHNQLPPTDLTSVAMYMPPDAPPLYNKDGSLNWSPDPNGNSSWKNPLSYLLQRSLIQTNNLVANSVIGYQLLPGLSVKGNLGYTYMQMNESYAIPLVSYPPEYRSFEPRSLTLNYNNINSWILEPQVEYNRHFAFGKIDGVAGGTLEQSSSNGQNYSATGFNSDLLLDDISDATQILAEQTAANTYRYSAVFVRLNYNWEDKYILNFSARRDGSSRFGSANQFHDFWSVGGAWVFSNENWMLKHLSVLNFGKLAGSYGTTGNDQIADYQFLSTYTTVGGAFPYQGSTGLAPSGLANPYLEWEETRKARLGLDLGFLKSRLLFSGGYFLTRSSNELLDYSLPGLTGFAGIIENFPATVQNAGWELSLRTVNVHTSRFQWSSNLNLTIPRNKLVKFPGLANSSYAYTYVLGKSLSVRKLYQSGGVNDSSGIYQWYTAKGQVSSNPTYPSDQTYLLNLDPVYYGGFDNTFSFRGFQLDIFLQFVKHIEGNNFENFGFVPGYFSGAFNTGNQPASVLRAWQKPGDRSTIQQYNSNLSLYQYWSTANSGSAAYSNASFVRLKNVSLSWQLPENTLKRLHLKQISFYAQGQNLLTFTRFTGLDPETNGNILSLPPLRVITFGIRCRL